MKKENKNIVTKTTDTLRNVTDDIVDSVQKNTDNIVETAQEGIEIVKDEIESAADYTKKNKRRVRDGILIIVCMLLLLSGGIFGTKIVTDKKEEAKKEEITNNIFPIEDIISSSEEYTIEKVEPVIFNSSNNQDNIDILSYYYLKKNDVIEYILEEDINTIELQDEFYNQIEIISKDYVRDSLSYITTKEGTYLIFIEKDKCNYKNMIYNIKTNKKETISILKTTC